MELREIESFPVDHTKLDRGRYLSRVDGDIIAYDIRRENLNSAPVPGNGVLHTLEHPFAAYVRNPERPDSIIYLRPTGCRTGTRAD